MRVTNYQWCARRRNGEGDIRPEAMPPEFRGHSPEQVLQQMSKAWGHFYGPNYQSEATRRICRIQGLPLNTRAETGSAIDFLDFMRTSQVIHFWGTETPTKNHDYSY